MEKLPLLETEANWPKNIEIPPLFNFQAALSSDEGVYNETSQDSLESCGFEVSESTPCKENLYEIISGPAGLISELEGIADMSIPTIDELLVMLLLQCTQNNFNETLHHRNFLARRHSQTTCGRFKRSIPNLPSDCDQ